MDMRYDASARLRLIERCHSLAEGDPDLLVACTIEQYFTGANEDHDFMCNIDPVVPQDRIIALVSSVRSRTNVQDVFMLVRLANTEEELWPHCEHILVITSDSANSVTEWLDSLSPSTIAPWDESDMGEYPAGAPRPKAGMHAFVLWWD